MIQSLNHIDQACLFWINKTLSNPILDWVMPIMTNEKNWIILILIFLIYLGIFSGKRGKITLVLLVIALGLSDYIAASILKPYIGRIRPSHTLTDAINLLVPKGGKWSMPSNHATNMFALAVVVGYFYSKWKWIVFSLATVIAFSRVYVGVHYPGDVIAGALLGYCLAWVVLSLWVIIKMRELKRGQTWVWYEEDPPGIYF